MATLCFFCGYAKALPNDPFSCGCHRVLHEDAEIAAPKAKIVAASPLHKRALPPALGEGLHSDPSDDFPLENGSGSKRQDAEFLDWTYTPKMEQQNDGSARCFTSTVQPTQGNRQHVLRLIREFDIEPSLAVKRDKQQKACSIGKAKEIRVREEDLRKWGDNLNVLSQKAIPPPPPKPDVKQASPDAKKKKRHTMANYYQKPVKISEGYGRQSLDHLEEFPRSGCNFHQSKLHKSVTDNGITQKNMHSGSKQTSSSLPKLGFSCTGGLGGPDVCSVEGPVSCAVEGSQCSAKKRFGFNVASTLGPSLSLPTLFAAGKSRPRVWRCPSSVLEVN